MPTVGVTSHGETWSASSEDITPRSQLIRTHAPNPAGSPFLRFVTSVRESVQVASSPCCQRVLPDSISANLSPDAWSPPPTVPPGAHTCFFPDVIGLPQDTMGRLPVSFRERDFPRASFRGCRHFVMFRPLSLRRLPDRSYRCESPHRAAETFTSGHIVLCYLRTLRICYPPIQVIDGKRTFTFPDLQPCRLLRCLPTMPQTACIPPTARSRPQKGR